jgi:prephenate dehydrogenase
VTRKSREAKAVVHQILEKIGAMPLEIDADRHDDIVSLTSHLPYVLSLSLSLLAKDVIDKDVLFKDFMASGFRGATRLSLTQEEMGKGILRTNSSKIINMIDEFSERLKRIESLVRDERELLDFLSNIRNFQSRIIEKDEGLR